MRDSMDARLFSSGRGAKGMAGARAGMNAAAGAATSKLRTPCRQAIVASNLSTCKEAAKRPLECPPSVVTTGSPTKSFSSPLPKRWCAGGGSRPAKQRCPGCPPAKINYKNAHKKLRRRSAAPKAEEGGGGKKTPLTRKTRTHRRRPRGDQATEHAGASSGCSQTVNIERSEAA